MKLFELPSVCLQGLYVPWMLLVWKLYVLFVRLRGVNHGIGTCVLATLLVWSAWCNRQPGHGQESEDERSIRDSHRCDIKACFPLPVRSEVDLLHLLLMVSHTQVPQQFFPVTHSSQVHKTKTCYRHTVPQSTGKSRFMPRSTHARLLYS